MKKTISLLCFILTLLCFSFQSNAQKTRTFAVVVGCSEYSTYPLNYCDDDAKHFYNYLITSETMTDSQIALLTDHQATKQNIINAMHRVFSMAGANDKILLFFSGHGTTGAFVPIDANSSRYSLLSHDEIKTIFKTYKTKYKVCLADACNAGSIYSGEPNYNSNTPSQDNTSVVLMMSSRSYELSQENPTIKQGAFTYYLLRGLKGKADRDNNKIVTISELFPYVKANVINFTNNQQTPFIEGKASKSMPMGYVK
jgi:uncharacterized caspase-like protein